MYVDLEMYESNQKLRNTINKKDIFVNGVLQTMILMFDTKEGVACVYDKNIDGSIKIDERKGEFKTKLIYGKVELRDKLLK